TPRHRERARQQKGVRRATQADAHPERRHGGDALPGNAQDRRDEQHGAEMDDRRRGERGAGLRRVQLRFFCDQRQDDELQADQGGRAAADDDVEAFPFGKLGHGVSYFLNRSYRYASSGPPFTSYASWAMSIVKGSVCRAMRSGPASTGSKPVSRMSFAATFLLLRSSPQYTRLG